MPERLKLKESCFCDLLSTRNFKFLSNNAKKYQINPAKKQKRKCWIGSMVTLSTTKTNKIFDIQLLF